ncbi:putative reverse transcriptase domain-containing protein [Tanacetum coccineum]
MAGYKHNQLRHKSFDDIQKLFDKALKRVNIFVTMDTKKVEGSKAKAAGNGSTKVYMRFEDMLKLFDREDMEALYRIVKDKFKSTNPVGDNKVLWGNLMTMCESSAGDAMWREQGRYLIKI